MNTINIFQQQKVWRERCFSSCHERGTKWVPLCFSLVTRRKYLSLFLYQAQNLPSLLFYKKVWKFIKQTQNVSICWCNKQKVFDQSGPSCYLGYFIKTNRSPSFPLNCACFGHPYRLKWRDWCQCIKGFLDNIDNKKGW